MTGSRRYTVSRRFLLGIVLLLAAAAGGCWLYWHFIGQPRRHERICRVNQVLIAESRMMYGLEGNRDSGVRRVIPNEELVAFLPFKPGIPFCPSGGSYVDGADGQPVLCSIHGDLQAGGVQPSAGDQAAQKGWLASALTPAERALAQCMDRSYRAGQAIARRSGSTALPPLHEPGVLGCQLLARECRKLGLAETNCVHGAPGNGVGGWQYANLSQASWNRILSRWPRDDSPWLALRPHGPPILWCGRGAATGRRMTMVLCRGPVEKAAGWYLAPALLSETELQQRVAQLNALLKGLGQAPVSLDVPADVDWAR